MDRAVHHIMDIFMEKYTTDVMSDGSIQNSEINLNCLVICCLRGKESN